MSPETKQNTHFFPSRDKSASLNAFCSDEERFLEEDEEVDDEEDVVDDVDCFRPYEPEKRSLFAFKGERRSGITREFNSGERSEM